MQKLITVIGLLFGGLAAACSNDVACPQDRVVMGDACLCRPGSVEVGGECVASEEVPGGGRDPVPAADDPGAKVPGQPTPNGEDDGRVIAEGPESADPDVEAPLPTSAGVDSPVGAPPAPGPVPPQGPSTSAPPSVPEPGNCEARCASRRCDDRGQCVVENSVCGNSVREGTEECDDGNNNPYDTCVKCRLPVCGDGYVQPSNNDEECEQGAFSPGWDDPVISQRTGGVQVWTADTCNFQYCTRRIYNVCSSHSQCPQGNECIRGMCTPLGCDEWSLEGCRYPACPVLPGFEVSTVVNISMSCFVLCRWAEPVCPVGTKCYRGFLGRADVCVGEHETE